MNVPRAEIHLVGLQGRNGRSRLFVVRSPRGGAGIEFIDPEEAGFAAAAEDREVLLDNDLLVRIAQGRQAFLVSNHVEAGWEDGPDVVVSVNFPRAGPRYVGLDVDGTPVTPFVNDAAELEPEPQEENEEPPRPG